MGKQKFLYFSGHYTKLLTGDIYMTESFVLLMLLGFGIGTLGTLIGAGGGFILVPILILFYPDLSPESITAISMAVVAANASVGSMAYMRTKRIDYKAGIIFALATIPGSILGVLTTKHIPKHQFDNIFGIVLIILSIFLFLRGGKEKKNNSEKKVTGRIHQKITDKYGETYEYIYNMKYGIALSIFVGFFSPLLGIGGGIIHVPAMVEWLQFPVHIATATSHFILAIMSTVSVIVHYFEGSYNDPKILKMVAALILGVIPGAFIGAYFSRKVKGKFIIKALAISLALVGIRILIASMHLL
ncbi:sulfite exporter TauE/SafE family protein [Elizabethkingia anophelis]|uniref:sulfite exporter TauE/SafE family protein n=1 Tax=Elizabethkingia anophelis TaxID=1117645 RepID=UPI0020B32C69|nr:sulfite exporter TauE/SafE family protein [Elizabethkingia anophelis]